MSQPEQGYLKSLKERYAQATTKERGKILDEYVKTTGCHRKHASAVLSGKRQRVKRPIRRPRSAIYTVLLHTLLQYETRSGITSIQSPAGTPRGVANRMLVPRDETPLCDPYPSRAPLATRG
jgi:hypothetical protein